MILVQRMATKKLGLLDPPPPYLGLIPKFYPFFWVVGLLPFCVHQGRKWADTFDEGMHVSSPKAFISSGTLAFTVIISGVTLLVLGNLSTTRYYFTRL